eukprot:CAMPEP_0202959326 /NCGR_PEP_ID=MMETSP1396-20130829/3539_1 /ASSEMBLY_ACC=CAM_ASM_000872 /TAXON_ID= /ORGANISM="Pseudokeronopsis sp., Strain Brazil" /LENGTH=46 /DNA_ID= /DNA_START= /DNA_END= /DNA_ORIENTATION=
MPDQEQIANSVKIVRICLRDDTVYEKIAPAYGNALGPLILEKMKAW